MARVWGAIRAEEELGAAAGGSSGYGLAVALALKHREAVVVGPQTLLRSGRARLVGKQGAGRAQGGRCGLREGAVG